MSDDNKVSLFDSHNADSTVEAGKLLVDLARTVSMRGTHAKVCLTFNVQDGIIQPDIVGEIVQKVRPQKRKGI